MEDILDQYEKPASDREPVICLDEQPIQLLEDSRPSEAARPGHPAKQDYEYQRRGTCSAFVAVEPKRGQRLVQVQKHRKKADFARFVRDVLQQHPHAKTIHLVLDNLNTHKPASLMETFGAEKAEKLLQRIEWHYTPKHASWLNMAEIELSALTRQCMARRIPSLEETRKQIRAWSKDRNRKKICIQWKFKKADAKNVFPSLYKRKKLAG